MLDVILKRMKNNEATEEERNKFVKEITYLVRSQKNIINESIARSNGLDYEELVSEATYFTYYCITKYKITSKVTTKIFAYTQWYVCDLHKKANRRRKIPLHLIDTFLGSQRPENSRFFVNNSEKDSPLNFDYVLPNNKDHTEEDCIFADYLSKVQETLSENKNTLACRILKYKLLGMTDKEIAEKLNIAVSKVYIEKSKRIREAVELVC